MKDKLFFTHMMLNRESNQRKSEKWIHKNHTDENTVFIPIWNGNYFFTSSNVSKKCLLELSNATDIFKSNFQVEGCLDDYAYFLGCDIENNNSATFVIDLSLFLPSLEKTIEILSSIIKENIESLDFRYSISLVSKEKASVLGYGRSLSHWHQSSQYCGFCGNKTTSKEGGHSRKCFNENCQKIIFPRTDPVVIMLVEYQQKGQAAKCLLAGHNRSPDNLLSVIAGFVDPGESLEQAVVREVYEEVGLSVEKIDYMASQPWPFPGSLMIGFRVKVKNNTIIIDDEELSSARWCTANEISAFAEWGEDGDDIQIPRKESIARYMIDDWIERNTL